MIESYGFDGSFIFDINFRSITPFNDVEVQKYDFEYIPYLFSGAGVINIIGSCIAISGFALYPFGL